MVAALVRPHPLSAVDERVLELPEGVTLADIARIVWPDEAMHRYVAAFIGATRVPREEWARVRPKAGAMVRLGLTCFQGGGDSKSIIAMVAVIVIAIFAPYAAAGILGAGASPLAVSALAAGITIAGSLAVSAIFKPPGIEAGTPPTNPADAPTYSITGQANAATPYGPMLRVYGRNRIFPRLAAVPFTTTEGPNQFLYMLLDCGYGPLDIAGLQIGDTPILNYADVLYRVHERWSAGDALELYRNATSYEALGVTITPPGASTERTSADDSSGLVLDFVMPRGLINFGAQGEHLARQLEFKIELRKHGAVAWEPARKYPVYSSHPTSSALSLAAQCIAPKQTGRFSYEFPKGIATFSCMGNPCAVGDVLYFASQEALTIDSVVNIGATQRLTFHPPLARTYFGFYAWSPILRETGNFVITDSTPSAILFSVNVEVPKGQYDVRVTRISALPTTDRQYDELVWNVLRSVTDRPPLAVQDDHTLIELKVRASEQLSGVLNNVNCIATSILPVWDGAAWAEEPTRNPAWAYVDVLTGTGAMRPLAASRLDLDALKHWADYCDTEVPNGEGAEPEPRVYFDHVVDYATTTYKLLQAIAAAGRAAPSVKDGRHGVIIDEERELPVQMFTPRNSWGFGARRSYLTEPDALRVKFIDPGNNWLDGEVVIYAAGKNAENATSFEDMKLFGVTRHTQATRDARYLKAQALLRREEFDIQCDLENLICQRGDLVVVQHDVLEVGGESSRIEAVAAERITLMDPFGVIDGAKRYGVRIRLEDGTITAPIEATPEAPATLVLSAVPEPSPQPGDLVAWGFLETETGEYIVKHIAPGNDLTAALTLAEVARGVYSADLGDIPAYVPPAGGRPTEGAGPAPANLRVEQQDKTIGREPYCDLVLAWDPAELGGYSKHRVYRIDDGVQTQLAEVFNSRVMVEQNVRLLDLDIEPRAYAVIGVDAIGRQSEPAFITYTPLDPRHVPGDVTYLSSNAHDKTTTLTWLAPQEPQDQLGNAQVLGYEVRWTPDDIPLWGQASRVTELVPWNVTTVTLPSRNGAYLVKALTGSLVESVLPAITVIAVEDLVIQDFWDSLRFEPEWAGVRDHVTVDETGRLVLIENPDGTYPAVGVLYATEREIFNQLLQSRISATVQASGLNNTARMADWIPLAMADPLAGSRRGVDWDASIWVAASQAAPYVMADWIPLESAAPLDPIPPIFGGDWRPLLHGEYLARELRFAVVLESRHANVTPRVEAAGVDIDFPERREEHGDILVPAAGLDFTFDRAFVFPPSIALDLQSAAPGDYIDRGAVGQAGFNVHVRSGAGVAKSGVIDVSAFGVGRVM